MSITKARPTPYNHEDGTANWAIEGLWKPNWFWRMLGYKEKYLLLRSGYDADHMTSLGWVGFSERGEPLLFPTKEKAEAYLSKYINWLWKLRN